MQKWSTQNSQKSNFQYRVIDSVYLLGSHHFGFCFEEEIYVCQFKKWNILDEHIFASFKFMTNN